MRQLLPLFIALPLAAAFSMLLLRKLDRRLPDIIANLTTGLLLAGAIAFYLFHPAPGLLVYQIGNWAPPLGLNLVLDGLSQLLLLTISLVAFLITIYSVVYMERYTGKSKFYALFMLMLAGMNGVVLTGDLFNLFVFLELATISSAILVAFGTEAEEVEASLKYFIMGTVASFFVLLAVILIYASSGTLNMAEVAGLFAKQPGSIRAIVALLFLVGLSTKAALIPFHAWLPDAHPAAPAPVSAMLSGVLIKSLGLYALIRIFYNVLGFTPQISNIFMVLGVISIFGGSLLALAQWDLKRLLACSSISQVGFIILGIGLGTPLGIMGGLFHMINHALFKPLLFLNAGAIEYSTGTRQLKELGGLQKKMPATFVTNLLASFSISGIPPFNGFFSKLFIILACLQVGKFWFALAATLGSILTLAYFSKMLRYVYFEKLPEALSQVREAPLTLTLVMGAFALLCLLGGILNSQVIYFLINPALTAIATGTGYGNLVLGGF